MADEEHVVKITADTRGVDAPLDSSEKKLKDLESTAKRFGSVLSNVLRKSHKETKDMVSDFDAIGKAANNFDMKKTQSELDKTAKRIDSILYRQKKMYKTGSKINSRESMGLTYDFKAETKKYEDLSKDLRSGLESEIARIKDEMQTMANMTFPTSEFLKISDAASKAEEKVRILEEREKALEQSFDITNTTKFITLQNNAKSAKDTLKSLQDTMESMSKAEMYSPAMQKYMSQLEETENKLNTLMIVRDDISSVSPGLVADLAKWKEINAKIQEVQSRIQNLTAKRDTNIANGSTRGVNALNNAIQTAQAEYAKLNAESDKMKSSSNFGNLQVFAKIDNAIQDTSYRMSQIQSVMQKQEQAGAAYSDSYLAIAKNIQITKNELDKISEAQNNLRINGIVQNTTEWKALHNQIQKARAEVVRYQNELDHMKESGADEQTGISTGAYMTAKAELDQYMTQLSNLDSQTKQYTSKVAFNWNKILGTVANKSKSVAKIIVNTFINAFKKAFTAPVKHISSLLAGFTRINHSANKSSKFIKNLTRSFMSLYMMLRNRALRLAMAEVFEDAKYNFNSIALISERFNASVSAMLNSVKQLGAQIVSAFEPVISVVGPIISAFVDRITNVADTVSQFLARITGNETYLQAAKSQIDYASTLDETTKSTKDATKATKEYENTVLGFDELHKLNGTNDSNLLGLDHATIEKAMTEATALNEIADRIRKAFKEGNWKGVGSGIAEIVNKAFAWLDNVAGWSKNAQKFTKLLKSIVDAINGFVDEIDSKLIGETIADVVNTIINGFDILTDPSKGINFTEIGKKIGKNLIYAVKNIEWGKLGSAFINGIQGVVKVLNGALSATIIDETTGETITLGTAISRALSDMFEGAINALNPDDWGSLIANLVNGCCDLIIGFFGDVTKIEELANKIAEMINIAVAKIDTDKLAAAITALATSFVTFVSTILSKVDWGKIWQAVCDVIKSQNFDWNSVLTAAGILAVPGIISKVLGGGVLSTISSLGSAFQGLGSIINSSVLGPLLAIPTAIWGIKQVVNAVSDTEKGIPALFSTIVESDKAAAEEREKMSQDEKFVSANFRAQYGLDEGLWANIAHLGGSVLAQVENSFSNALGLGNIASFPEYKAAQTAFEDATVQALAKSQETGEAIGDIGYHFVAFRGELLSAQEYVDLFSKSMEGLQSGFIEFDGQTYEVTEQMRETATQCMLQGDAVLNFGNICNKTSDILTNSFADPLLQFGTETRNLNTTLNDTVTELERINGKLSNIDLDPYLKSIIQTDYGDAAKYRRINHYASGGLVGDGQLFIANEGRVAELIGSDGQGNTAVVNNEQIISAVVTGVKSAVLEAGMFIADRVSSSQSGSGGDIVLEADSIELARVVNRGNKQIDRRGNHKVVFA